MFRSFSDIESGRIRMSPQRSNLESNCNQIFTMTPTVTKEMLQKLQNAELGPKHAVVCGYELHMRQVSVLIALFLLFVLSIGVTIIFWATTVYSQYILSKMVISNTSEYFDTWKNPVPAQVKIYIFNYTNVEDVEAGYDKKFNLKELGPYTYRDTLERTNVKFSDDGKSVSFQEKHTYDFLSHLSPGRRQNDRVIVPNVPMLGAAAMSKHSFYLTRIAMSGLFRSLNAYPFLKVPADKFIFGYDDDLYNLAKGVLALTKPLPFDKFGLLASRNGLSNDIMEIHTGKDDVDKVGTVLSINKKDSYDHWLNDECNRIGGSDGYLYSQKTVQAKKPVNIFLKDICRKVQYNFEKEEKILNDAIPTNRYVLPDNVFGHPDIDNSGNQCYCDIDGECPKHGLFNATKCAYGSPFFVSLPHFHNGDPSLRAPFNGLKPDKKKHQTYVDVHPVMGFATQGWTRVQSNIQVQKSPGLMQLSIFDDDVVLPIAWIEFGLDVKDSSDETKQLLYDITFMVAGVEMAFQYGSILMVLVTFVSMLIVVRGKHCRRSVDQGESENNSDVRLIS